MMNHLSCRHRPLYQLDITQDLSHYSIHLKIMSSRPVCDTQELHVNNSLASRHLSDIFSTIMRHVIMCIGAGLIWTCHNLGSF